MAKELTIDDYPFEEGEWNFYSQNIRKKYGWKGWYKQFWHHIRRPWSRSQISEFAPLGVGLEVGCGEWTIAPVRRTILSDAFEEHVGNQSLAKVYFPADNIPYPNESFNFILSEHVLEHLIDPSSVLVEWMRCLRSGGKIILFLPDKDRIFDVQRPRTRLTELISRRDNKEGETQRLLNEWIDYVIKDGLAPHYIDLSPEEMVQTGSIHYNVWKVEDIQELAEHIGYTVLKTEPSVPDRSDSFMAVLSKP